MFRSSPSLPVWLALASVAAVPLHAQQASPLEDHLGPAQNIAQTRTIASQAVLSTLKAEPRKAISLAAGNFGSGSFRSLATGYAVGSGGMVSLQAGADPAGGAAFDGTTRFFDAGVRPDLLVAADVNNDGQPDLVAAARDGSVIRVLLGGAEGTLLLQPAVPVTGRIVSLAAWRGADGANLIAVGVAGARNAVDLYRTDGTLATSIALPDEPAVLTLGSVNRHGLQDLIVGGAGTLSVVDGSTVASGSPHIDTLPVAGAVAAVEGIFAHDERNLPQIAVLTADGSVHILARTGIESTPKWVTVANAHLTEPRGMATHGAAVVDPSSLAWFATEVLPGVASIAPGEHPVFAQGRLTGTGGDDLVIVAGGSRTTIAHALEVYPAAAGESEGTIKALAPRIVTTPGVSALAAIPMRVSASGSMGLVAADGSASPQLSPSNAGASLYVTNTGDGAPVTGNCPDGSSSQTTCRLRDALAKVNGSTTTVYNVYLTPGTFNLTYNSSGTGADTFGNLNYHIEIDKRVNIIGAGTTSTFINAGQRDKIFSINPGYTVAPGVFDTYISNMTLQSGLNTNDGTGNTSANPLGGALDDELYGAGHLTLVNVNFTGNTAKTGSGGALYVSDGVLGNTPGNGSLEIDGGAFTSNVALGPGGAISTATNQVAGDVPVLISGITVANNSSTYATNTASGYTSNGYFDGSGGGMMFAADTQSGVASSIDNSVFSGNTGVLNPHNAPASTSGTSCDNIAYASCGGGLFAGSGLTITDSRFTGNTTGGRGGGVYVHGQGFASTLSGNTITGNSAPDGGGVFVSNLNATQKTGGTTGLTLQTVSLVNNRITGNTASGTTTRVGLAVRAPADTASHPAVTANDNFWGCNGLATGTGCDTAAENGQANGNLTLATYAAVTATLNTTTPAYGSNLVLTGALTKNSSGTALSNINAFTGVSSSANTVARSGATSTSPGGTASTTLTISTGVSNGTTLNTALPASATASFSSTVTTSGTASVKIDNATVAIPYTVPISQPTAVVAFSPASIVVGGSSTLTYILTNPNAGAQLSGVAFSDTMPTGLVISNTPALSSTCGGSATATAGGSLISLSNGSIAGGSNCVVSVSTTATTAGSKQTSIVPTATNANTAAVSSNTATLSVAMVTPGIVLSAPATANRGTAATLAATITIPSGGPTLTGTVTFLAGATTIGTVSVSGSGTTYTATLSSAALPSGTQSITARYDGDANYSTVTSTTTTTVVVANIVWIGNPSAGTVSAFDPGTAAPFLATAETSGGTGVAIDSVGSVWSLKPGSNAVAKFTNTGTVTSAGFTGGGLSTPTALAIDGQGLVWITNTANSLSVFNNDGSAFSATAYKGGTGTYPPANTVNVFSTPGAVAIDTSGNVWVVNTGSSSVTEVIGAASPTVSPLATGVANITLGTQP